MPIGVPDHPGLALYFLHCDNPRHHSVALFEADIPGGLVHVMIEVEDFDDLGRCIDRCKKGGAPISINMGRHSNDLMVSTYITTPSGFDIEYGWDGWQVDWSDYVPTKSEIFSLWGHPEMAGLSISFVFAVKAESDEGNESVSPISIGLTTLIASPALAMTA